jgi:hypothetical protein
VIIRFTGRRSAAVLLLITEFIRSTHGQAARDVCNCGHRVVSAPVQQAPIYPNFDDLRLIQLKFQTDGDPRLCLR